MAFKNISQPENFAERCDLAKRMRHEFELPMTVLVDTMEDTSRALFSDLPSPAFVIDADGVIQAKFPWAEAEVIDMAVKQILETGRFVIPKTREAKNAKKKSGK